jgi:hypothetical protein
MAMARSLSGLFLTAALAWLGGCCPYQYQVIVTTDGQSLERDTKLKVDIAYARNEEDVRKLDSISVKDWFTGGRDNIRPVSTQLTLASKGPDAQTVKLVIVSTDYDNPSTPTVKERQIKEDIEGLYVFVDYGTGDAGAKRLIKRDEFYCKRTWAFTELVPIIEIAVGRTQIADVRYKEPK